MAADSQPGPAGPAQPAQPPPQLEVNYIYTTSGVHVCPPTYIDIDNNLPVKISAQQWREVRHKHCRWTGASLTNNQEFETDAIVVMSKPGKTLWFIRYSIDGGSKFFKQRFGENFLFQLPYVACVQIESELAAWEKLHNIPVGGGSRLVDDLSATNDEFHPADWPMCTKVDTIPCYYDRSFAMSIRPSASTMPKASEGVVEPRQPQPRPISLQPAKGKAGAITAQSMPDDVLRHIFDFAFGQWAASPNQADWSILLKMRTVCKTFNHIAEDQTTRFLEGTLDCVRRGFLSHSVGDIGVARDVILDSGLTTLQLICDANKMCIYNWMRLRFNKKPGTKPPVRFRSEGPGPALKVVFPPGSTPPRKRARSREREGERQRQRQRWSPSNVVEAQL